MLILFGSRSYTNKDLTYTDLKCCNCEQEGSIAVFAFHNYFHLFMIPTFPIGSQYAYVCQECGAEYDEQDIILDEETKRKVRRPLWLFSGLLVFLAIGVFALLYGNMVSNTRERELKAFMSEPRAGVMLEVEYDYDYSLIRIEKVTPDSIYFSNHEYVIGSRRLLYTLQEDESKDQFSDDVEGYTYQEVGEMVDNGFIIGIHK